LWFCNIAGFPATLHQNPKVIELQQSFISQMDLDIFAGCVFNLNWTKIFKPASLWEWFCSELPLHSITNHNLHDNFHWHQLEVLSSWAWGALPPVFQQIPLVWVNGPGLSPRPCRPKHKNYLWLPSLLCREIHLQTVYSQHKQHLESQDDYTCPHVTFL